MFSEEVSSFFGVDVKNVSTEEGWERDRIEVRESWERERMGITDSTYYAYKVVTWDNIIAMGYRMNLNNTFAWEKMVLNLPGSKEYDCQWPWVFNKIIDGILAEDIFIYVDDGYLNWSLIRNGSRLDPFKWRGICTKCQKKVV